MALDPGTIARAQAAYAAGVPSLSVSGGSTGGGSRANYYYGADDHGGVNYFYNGNGITNAQYAKATGANTTDIENQAAAIYAQNKLKSGNYTGGSNGGSSNIDPSAQAAYNNQANGYQDQYNSLDGQLEVGQRNLDNSYKTNLNDLNDNNAIAQRNYNTQNTQNSQNFLNTKNSILSNTRASANSLQRLLNLNGAGNSSAATEAAPYAAALQGSTNLNGAQTTYAQNQSNLDTNWQDTERAYKKNLDALSQNRFAQQQSLQSNIAQQRINLLNQISGAKQQAGIAGGQSYAQAVAGNAGRDQQVKDLLASLTGYANQYQNDVPVNTNVTYASPTLSDYTLGQQAQASNGQSGAAGNIATPFLNLLTSQKKDIYGNPVYA